MEKAARTDAQAPSPSKVGEPVIILAFDEAHALTDQKFNDLSQNWSAFSQLRRSLRALNEHRLFSVFLSTTGKITQFTSPKRDDESTRVQRGEFILIIPFSDLGFDQLARKIAIDGSCSLEEVASDAHMVTLGRPL